MKSILFLAALGAAGVFAGWISCERTPGRIALCLSLEKLTGDLKDLYARGKELLREFVRHDHAGSGSDQ